MTFVDDLKPSGAFPENDPEFDPPSGCAFDGFADVVLLAAVFVPPREKYCDEEFDCFALLGALSRNPSCAKTSPAVVTAPTIPQRTRVNVPRFIMHSFWIGTAAVWPSRISERV